MWNEVKSCLKNTQFAVRLELRPTDRNLDEYDYIQAVKPNYFPTVIDAASLVFESTFAPDEAIAMLCRRWGSKRTHIRTSGFGLKQVQFDQDVSLSFKKRKTKERGIWIREALVLGDRRKFNHRNIFLGIAHADFNIQPMIREWVVFVSLQKELVYFMYDDRGVLIASPSKETLPTLPENLNILRYEDVRPSEFLL